MQNEHVHGVYMYGWFFNLFHRGTWQAFRYPCSDRHNIWNLTVWDNLLETWFNESQSYIWNDNWNHSNFLCVCIIAKNKTKKQNKKTNKNKNKNFLKYGDLSIISGYLRYSALVLQLHRSNPWKLLALFFKRILLDHLSKGNKVCCLLYWSQMQNNLRVLKVYYSHLKSKQGLQGSAMNLWP